MMRQVAPLLCALLLAVPSLLSAQPPMYRGRSVAQWSDDLSHPNSVVRVQAAVLLGRLGSHADQAVEPLISALGDRNADVRLHAAAALGRINLQPEECLVALTRRLADEDEHVRFAAEWSLARIAGDLATEPLASPNADTLDTLLAAAEKALSETVRNFKHLQQITDARAALSTSPGRLAASPPNGQARSDDDVLGLLADLQSDDKLTQLRAIETLGRSNRAAELVEAWRVASEDGFLRWHLTRALITIGRPAVPVVADALQDADESVAQDAAQTLRRMGPSAIGALPRLLAVIEDPNRSDEIREAAIWGVESFGPASVDTSAAKTTSSEAKPAEHVSAYDTARDTAAASRTIATLVGVLQHEDEDSLIAASARTLRAIGPAARDAEATLIEILTREDHVDWARTAAAEALPAINPTSTEAADALVTLVNQHEDPYFVSSLAQPLAEYGALAAGAVPRLIKLSEPTTDYEREGIIRALGNIGPPALEAVPRLIERLTDVEEYETVQVASAVALGKLGPNAVVSLAQQLEHPDPQVRRTIARGLVEIGAGAAPVAHPLELRLLDRDEDPNVKALIAVALGQIGPPARSAIPTLTRIAGDVRQAVFLRAMSTVAIGQIDPEQWPILVAALDDPQPEIRVAAAYSLQRLPTPHADGLPALIRALEDDDTRAMAMGALREFKDESLPLLSLGLQDRAKDDQTRVAYLNLISENGVVAGQQLLEALNDAALAESAYWSLRDLGNDSIPLLISAADNEEKYTLDARDAMRELVEEMFGGIGGGDGEDAWVGGHALFQQLTEKARPAAAMASPVSDRSPPRETPNAHGDDSSVTTEPEEMLASEPEPEPDPIEGAAPSDADVAAARVAPETGQKSVKVFYGTNREPLDDGARNGHRLPWYAWLLIVGAASGLLVFVVKQFRRGANGRGTIGVAGLVLFCLAVEVIVTRGLQLERTSAKPGPTYGTQYSSRIEMGFCEVTIPAGHQEGQLEGPSFLRLQVLEDPEKHIVLKRVRQLEPEAFFAELDQELDQRGNSILVFVHGYNTSFENAARRTAQMSHDLKFDGAPIFYSWPSQANWRKYRVDEKNVELSITPLKTFLLDIARDSGADSINLIAHSMGNRALTNALKEIEITSTAEDKLFNQVILAAPDIDADIFRERIAPAIVSKARRVTLYASSKDLALVASREFNSGDPRAGDAGGDLVVVPGIETIDVSAGESSLLGHSYYGDSTSVLHDIGFLLRDRPAAERPFLEPVPRWAPTHWLFQPSDVARRGGDENVRR